MCAVAQTARLLTIHTPISQAADAPAASRLLSLVGRRVVVVFVRVLLCCPALRPLAFGIAYLGPPRRSLGRGSSCFGSSVVVVDQV